MPRFFSLLPSPPSSPPSLAPDKEETPSFVRGEEKSAHGVCIIGEKGGSALVPTHHHLPCTSCDDGRDEEGAREDRVVIFRTLKDPRVCGLVTEASDILLGLRLALFSAPLYIDLSTPLPLPPSSFSTTLRERRGTSWGRRCVLEQRARGREPRCLFNDPKYVCSKSRV